MNKNFLSFLSAFFSVLFLVPFTGIAKTFLALHPSTTAILGAAVQYVSLSAGLVSVLFWFSRAKTWGHILFWAGVNAWMLAWAVRAIAQSDRWVTLLHLKFPYLLLFAATIGGLMMVNQKWGTK